MSKSALILLVSLTTAMTTLTDGEMELLLVHAVWRHGDRLPIEICPTDPIQEDDWALGGGGFGQLTPLGMAQQFKFGKLLREFYVETGFLSKKYSSKEIYILSTDVNRTIISAMSNMLGMYGQPDGSSRAEIDYPNATGWPVGYVPIPVHTIDFNTDHVGNPNAECKRLPLLWKMAKSSPELQTFQKRADVVELIHQLTGYCGKSINIENLWIVQDSLFVEQIHRNATLRAKNKWFTDDLYNRIDDVLNQIVAYQNGLFDDTVMINNLDIGLEMRKIRGGSLINDINSRMNMKLDCMNRASPICKWIKPLKYFVYSAHDTTVNALLSVLGITKKVVQPGGYPPYTSAVFIELWINHTNNQPYFKLLYHKNAQTDILYSITPFIDACGKATYCKLEIFEHFAATTKPDEPMETWCNVDPHMQSKSSTSLWKLLKKAFDLLSWLWPNA